MPCWYYEKKDLQQTPSFKDGISAETEARYRRDGARFIIDAGTKMGLRYDTCATGVVYFHRFYMFHSFKEFHRFVTAGCCLFLAGKVEETPKKCKDLIKMTRSMLTDAQFSVFGEDPKEEVMTLERILLQTIKFDLMVEHPYAYLLKFAKLIKGDKNKIQKMVQMAWTFINDSLCTTLCLQWEPEIIAVALMYLTSRLNKFEIADWQGKPLGYRGKWYEFLVEDVTLELLEDICHQVLDLYSKPPQKAGGESPNPHCQHAEEPTSHLTPKTPISPQSVKKQSTTSSMSAELPMETDAQGQPPQESPSLSHSNESSIGGGSGFVNKTTAIMTPQQQKSGTIVYTQTNPYLTGQMYSSSFMSQEGSQSIQSLIGIESSTSNSYQQTANTSSSQYTLSTIYQQQQQQQQSTGYQQILPGSYQQSTNLYQNQLTDTTSYPTQSYSAYTGQYDMGCFPNQPQQMTQSYPVQTGTNQFGEITSSVAYQAYSGTQEVLSNYSGTGSGTNSRGGTVRTMTHHNYQAKSAGSGLPSVRITGRQSSWR